MVRVVVCGLAFALIMLGLKSALHSLQWVGLLPYLAICAGFVTVCYLVARMIDARNHSRQVPPPERPYSQRLAQSRRLLDAD
jgi:hypothetical protein